MGADRFQQAEAELFAAHAEDPKRLEDGQTWSTHYHRRLAHYVDALSEGPASPELRLAALAQHIRRWTIPRGQFPEGRSGYKKWRSTLAQFHADQAEKILLGVGYPSETAQRVRELLTKRRLGSDPEVQLFEDAICLVFLENEFGSFSEKHDADKVVDIVQKTWAKMSARGHQAALELAGKLPEATQALLGRALS